MCILVVLNTLSQSGVLFSLIRIKFYASSDHIKKKDCSFYTYIDNDSVADELLVSGTYNKEDGCIHGW